MSWEEKEKDRSYHELARVTENFNEDSVLFFSKWEHSSSLCIETMHTAFHLLIATRVSNIKVYNSWITKG
jgi:hypothetical protein